MLAQVLLAVHGKALLEQRLAWAADLDQRRARIRRLRAVTSPTPVVWWRLLDLFLCSLQSGTKADAVLVTEVLQSLPQHGLSQGRKEPVRRFTQSANQLPSISHVMRLPIRFRKSSVPLGQSAVHSFRRALAGQTELLLGCAGHHARKLLDRLADLAQPAAEPFERLGNRDLASGQALEQFGENCLWVRVGRDELVHDAAQECGFLAQALSGLARVTGEVVPPVGGRVFDGLEERLPVQLRSSSPGKRRAQPTEHVGLRLRQVNVLDQMVRRRFERCLQHLAADLHQICLPGLPTVEQCDVPQAQIVAQRGGEEHGHDSRPDAERRRLQGSHKTGQCHGRVTALFAERLHPRPDSRHAGILFVLRR